MSDQRRITPGNLAAVALADIDDQDSIIYWDANEPVASARTKRVTIADLRSFLHASPVVIGVDPNPMANAALRVGGNALIGGACTIDDDASVGGDLAVAGTANIVGAITAGGTLTIGGISYTWPGSQGADLYLKTDGAGALSWDSPVLHAGINDLDDVTITAATAGQMLRWNGTAWVNSTDGSALTALNAANLSAGTVPNARLSGAYTGVVGLGIQTAALQFDDALYDIGSGGKRPRDFILSRNATIGGTLGVTGAVTAASFSGDGAALTALNGTAIATGTVAAARLATHDLISAHTAGGLTAGQVVRASAAAVFAWAVLQFSDLGGVPTTIAGFGITDAFTKTESDARFAAIVHVHSAADITTGTLTTTRGGTGVSNPTLGNLYLGAGAAAMTALAPGAVGGYVRSTGSAWARSALLWTDLSGVPTTVGGFGITDAYTKTESDARYSQLDAAVSFSQVTISKAAGNARTLRLATAGSARWDLAANTAGESGANAGSAFTITAYDDSGVVIDTPITITRAAAGAITLARHVSAGTDATYDLGSGNRFRDLVLSRNATIGGGVAVTGAVTAASATITTISGTTLGVSGTSTLAVLHATGAVTFDSTLGAGATTVTTLHATGAVTFDADFAIATNKFTVAAASGNTVVAGTLSAAGTTVSTLHATGAVTFDAALTTANGGTGLSSFTAGDMTYYAAGTTLSAVAIGTAGKVLRSTGSAPAWSTVTFTNAATAGDLMVATGANAWGSLAIGANLRILQSNGSAAAWVANLDLGSGTLNVGAATVTTLHATGAVTMDSTATVAGLTSSANVTANGAAATHRGFRITTAGSLRWFARGDDAAEAGANAGTAWRLSAYDDSGVAIDDPIVVTRASGGTLYLQRPVQFTGGVEFASDAAYDIGATNRPRDFRLSRNALIGGTLGVTGAVSLTVALTTANGGTGLASYTAGDMVYFAAGTLFSKLAIGANKTVLQSNGSIPVWSANIDIGSGTIASGAHTITSTSASAFVVGPNGTSNPVFTIDASTASQAAGLSLTGAVAAGTVALGVVSSGAAANLTVNAKGTGTIGIGTTSTGNVTIGSVIFTSAGAVSAVTTLAASSTATFSGVTDASSSTTGIVQVAGGVGIAKSLFVGTVLDVGTTAHVVGAATFDSTINGVTIAQNAITFGAGSTTITAGTGASRTLTFRTTTSGSTATTALTLNADQSFTFAAGGSVGGNLLAGTDAAFDFGASGANRFRDFFLSRNLVAGGTGAFSSTLDVTGNFRVNTNKFFVAASTGVFNAFTFAYLGGNNTDIITSSNASTGYVALADIQNTSGRFTLGIEGSSGGVITTGTAAYSSVVSSFTDLELASNNVVRIHLASGGDISMRGNVLAGTDATYDLGASAASRFRDFYLSRNITVGGNIVMATGSEALIGSSGTSTNTQHSFSYWNGSSYISKFAVGAFGISVASGVKIFVDGGGDSYLYESAPNVTDMWSAGIRSMAWSGGGVYLTSVSTTASAANVFTDNADAGQLKRSTSSLRFKEFDRLVDIDEARTIMFGLSGFWYNSSASGDLVEGEVDRSRWYVGFAAEDAAKMKATRGALHTVDESGAPNWFQYERIGVVHNVILKDHETRLADQRATIDDLFADVDRIDQEFSEHELRILALESEVEHLTTELAALQG